MDRRCMFHTGGQWEGWCKWQITFAPTSLTLDEKCRDIAVTVRTIPGYEYLNSTRDLGIAYERNSSKNKGHTSALTIPEGRWSVT